LLGQSELVEYLSKPGHDRVQGPVQHHWQRAAKFLHCEVELI